MAEQLVIRVRELVGSPFCVASNDGDKLFDRVAESIRRNRPVALSFEGVDNLTWAFLNSAIGRLYGEFTQEQIGKSLSVKHAAAEDVALMDIVGNAAKAFFRDPQLFKRAAAEVYGCE